MRNFSLLCVTERAQAAVAPYRIVKPTATEGVFAQASAATDRLYGVSTSEGADAADAPLDIETIGIVSVLYGGAVAAGAPLTSDAQGRAVTAAAGNKIVGYAHESGALDEIGSVRIAPGQLET